MLGFMSRFAIRNVEPSRPLPQRIRAFEHERLLCISDEMLLKLYQIGGLNGRSNLMLDVLYRAERACTYIPSKVPNSITVRDLKL